MNEEKQIVQENVWLRGNLITNRFDLICAEKKLMRKAVQIKNNGNLGNF